MNHNWFFSGTEARETIENWHQDYNEYRPYSSLDQQTPSEFVAQLGQDLFKNNMGQSPARYVQEVRPMRARDLVESSSLSIKQIMILVGTKDRSNFERRFKRAYELTPVQYRKAAGLKPSQTDALAIAGASGQ